MNCKADNCAQEVHARGYCNLHYRRLMRYGNPRADLPVDFVRNESLASRLERWTRPTSTCDVWTGGLNEWGYGVLKFHNSSILAHRASYELANGPIPNGLAIDHICHVRSCVNPAHLRLVNAKQNAENLAGAHANSKSGVRGVWKHNQVDKWVAQFKHNNETRYLGLFDTIEDANAAVTKARREAFTHSDMDNLPALDGEGK